jgi:hypothetical protein
MTKRKPRTDQTVRPRSYVTNDGWTHTAPLVDMPVDISLEDILAGVCSDSRKCVIAQAIRRVLGPVTAGVIDVIIGVGRAEIILHSQKLVLRYDVPGILKRALQHFDSTNDGTGKGQWGLEPGTYYLRAMPDYIFNRGNRFGEMKGDKKPNAKSTTVKGKRNGRSSINAVIRARATPTRKMANITDVKQGVYSPEIKANQDAVNAILNPKKKATKKKATKKKAAKRTPKKKGNK